MWRLELVDCGVVCLLVLAFLSRVNAIRVRIV